MKIKGAEFMEWFDHHFPEGYYWDGDLGDDHIHNKDGEWLLDPKQTYTLEELGYLAHDDPEKPELNASRLISKWRRERTHEVFTVDVPKDRVDEIVNYLRGRGCKVKT